MSIVKKNIVANFAGSVWQGAMIFIFIPFYIKFMGVESWGLVGFFSTLLAVFGLLDMGLSQTINREMARLSILSDKEQETRNLVRTLEIIYWGIAIFIGIIVVSISSLLAHHWIKAENLSYQTIEQALLIMGFVIALQMPISFYSGGLMGLQKLVLLNVINSFMSLFRGGGAVLILWLYSPTIQAFFLWQIFASVIHNFILFIFLWKEIPFPEKPAVFQKKLLKGIWKFAAGMSGITILAVILTQLDKIILSKMLSLKMFGYYTLASIISLSLGRIFVPIYNSIYPKLTQLVSMGDNERLTRFYHESCQFMSVLIFPIAVVIAFFSYEILLVWTQNPTLAQKSYLILKILICGTVINGVMYLPYGLQLAYGWTKLSFFKNVIAVVVLGPLIIYLTIHFGAIGAASAWLILNIGYILFEIPILHKRLLCREKWHWYRNDVGIPLIISIFIIGICKIFVKFPSLQYMMILYLVSIIFLTIGIVASIVPVTRVWLLNQLARLKA